MTEQQKTLGMVLGYALFLLANWFALSALAIPSSPRVGDNEYGNEQYKGMNQ
jgi:hypothetical protein